MTHVDHLRGTTTGPSRWSHALRQARPHVAERRGVSRAQVALAWLPHRPVVTSPIVGVNKPAHLADAVAAVDLELSDAELDELGAAYVPHAISGHA